ncbi:competence protein CoiA family protein [Paenibacillus glycinis]|uniref:Competence protein CoiA n=1 Tax=Paenibacillus glycinis TaxID=2697035 RepID=A0ABW9XSI9_9BACL|nr:competence protein CoiA family protein [Paenibacillus glycinis]NBD25636.1 competence protein CoiA [Paenibacillus glycinis]
MFHAIYEGKLFNIEEQILNCSDRKQEVANLKKRADKGAYVCPHCGASLIVKAGDVRGVFFAHSSGDACALKESYDTYKKQTARESKQHSVMREIVHEVLKNQEKIRNDLQVDFGYIAKAKERWSYFPDIVLKNQEQELAISILTNVDRTKDSKLTKQIKKRNTYFKEKGLQTLWFIEDQELSLDWDNHVIHLWESEIDLSVKTKEDSNWDKLIQGLNEDLPTILDTLGYWRKNKEITLDTRSLYYIYSTNEGIDFSVHRFIIDEIQFPHRAFALTRGYRMNISTALAFNEKLALSDPGQETNEMDQFYNKYIKRKEEEASKKTQLAKSQLEYTSSIFTSRSTDNHHTGDKSTISISKSEVASSLNSPYPAQTSKKMNYTDLKNNLREKFGMTQKEQLRLWNIYVLKRGIKDFDLLWLVAQQLDNFDQFEKALNEYNK